MICGRLQAFPCPVRSGDLFGTPVLTSASKILCKIVSRSKETLLGVNFDFPLFRYQKQVLIPAKGAFCEQFEKQS